MTPSNRASVPGSALDIPFYRRPGWENRPCPPWRTEREKGLGMAQRVAEDPNLFIGKGGLLHSRRTHPALRKR